MRRILSLKKVPVSGKPILVLFLYAGATFWGVKGFTECK